MSLFCDSGGFDTDGYDWWWCQPADEEPLETKRSRKCCSCDVKIGVGETARKVLRFRPPTESEAARGIAYDEVSLSSWYLCEKCGDLAYSLSELGFCYSLGDTSLAEQIAEHRSEEDAHRKRMASHNE